MKETRNISEDFINKHFPIIAVSMLIILYGMVLLITFKLF